MSTTYFPTLKDIESAEATLKEIISSTPLQRNRHLSNKYEANVFLKREDLQIVRSYKIRGAYNKIRSLSAEETGNGIVCASAGNHAQGVAHSCNTLKIYGKIFMPLTTPKQKIRQVNVFGGEFVEIILVGDSFDLCSESAREYCTSKKMTFIHPFDDPKIIEGQATVGAEIINDIDVPIDYLFAPIGGGGMISGVGSYFKLVSPDTKIIGVEPAGAASMALSFENGCNTTMDEIDTFVDGAAVKRVGTITFEIAQQVVSKLIAVPEGKICTTILDMYERDAIVVEPAGALSVAALDSFKDEIKGKNVVCIVSGGNNDITRMEEIKERSLLYEGLKHYFIVNFPQRSGALSYFASTILGPNDDITFFEYKKKTHRENGPAMIGVELKCADDLIGLMARFNASNIRYQYLNDNPDLFGFLI